VYYAFEFLVTLVSSLTIISISVERYLCLFKTLKVLFTIVKQNYYFLIIFNSRKANLIEKMDCI
jgi:hypothetical protein